MRQSNEFQKMPRRMKSPVVEATSSSRSKSPRFRSKSPRQTKKSSEQTKSSQESKSPRRSRSLQRSRSSSPVKSLSYLTPEKPAIKRSPKLEKAGMNRYLVPPSYPNQQVVYVKNHVKQNEMSRRPNLTPEKPAIKRSPKLEKAGMNRYLVPPSYPNQQVVYVKNHVKQNEMSKFDALKEDLHNVKHLMDQTDLETLPDGGMRLTQRLSELLEKVKQQGEKVARMVVEPENPDCYRPESSSEGPVGKLCEEVFNFVTMVCSLVEEHGSAKSAPITVF